MLRDGFHQQAVHAGVAPYRPNSLDGGNPFKAGDAEKAFIDIPVTVAEAPKIRQNPVSFDDHFSQVRLFWSSMTQVEKEHIVRAYTFELGKCYEQTIKE
jgi:catalase